MARVAQSRHDATCWEMVKQPSFYLIYIMMTLVAFGGLVVTAQLKEIAGFYQVDKVIVASGLSASILAIQLNRIVNGVTRPLWGWISDHVGRENAMFTAFSDRGHGDLGMVADHSSPCSLRAFVEPSVLRLVRDLLAVPVHHGGSVWPQMGYDKLRDRVHVEGHRLDFCGTSGGLCDDQDRLMGSGVLRHDCLRYRRGFMALLLLKPLAKRTIAREDLLEEKALAKAEAEKELVHA